jgi:hypothetical protein
MGLKVIDKQHEFFFLPDCYQVLGKVKSLATLIVAAISLTIGGCYPILGMLAEENTDVTEQKKYWGGYKPGEVYRLKQNVFLVHYGGGYNNYLIPPGEGSYSLPDTEDAYHAKPDAYPRVDQIVPRMTRLRIESFVWHKSLNTEGLDIYADVLSGQLHGETVEITKLSKRTDNVTDPPGPWKPNHKYIEQVRK